VKRAPRGFTLLELMIGATIALVVIGAVTATFIGQNQAFVALDLNRIAADASRDAFLELEPSIRRAGFGIDPRFAFDFAYYACPGANCRDSITGPDNLVFYARNPTYVYTPTNSIKPDGTNCTDVGGCVSGNAYHATITAVGAVYNVSVDTRTGASTPLRQGQVVQFVCPSAAAVTMATLSATPTMTGTPATQVGIITLSYTATPGTPPASNDPTLANAFGSNGCFTQPGVLMFLVDRFHYLVQTYNGVPWLVLDTGTDLDGNGTIDVNDYVPIAAGVEDVQFAYVLNINAPSLAGGGAPPSAPPGKGPDAPTAGGVNAGNWVIGDYFTGSGASATGTQEQPDMTLANMPQYTTPLSDPTRFNTTAANIRAVRIDVNIRSLQTDQSKPVSWTGDVEKQVENLNGANLQSGGRLRRFSYSTTVACRNMESRSAFVF
jgi:type IV pilus assembly protein PilW